MTWWRGGERLATIGLGLALAWSPPAPAAPPAAPKVQLVYSKQRAFKIPYNFVEADRPRYKQLQLWVSADGGDWQKADTIEPEAPAFFFRAPRDGEYWFAVRTLDAKNRLIPSDVADVEPNMRVIVDSTVPAMTLDSLPRRGSLAAVRWEVVDEHLNLESLRLEYSADGGREWTPVAIHKPARIGQERWDAGTAEPIKVRLSVADRAKNVRSLGLDLPDGSPAAGPLDQDAPPPRSTFASSESERSSPPPILGGPPSMPPMGAGPGGPEPVGEANPFSPREARGGADGSSFAGTDGPAPPILVTSPKFGLQYEVEDPGPNGPAAVELFVTTDGGRTWFSRGEDPDRRSPFPVDLGGEGSFGLKLVARSSANQGDQPPVAGEPPRTIVEVDASGPAIKLDPPRIAGGRVTIAWHANDPHPAPRSVMISVRSEAADAKWQNITPAPVDNSGQFTWALPANCPPKIHFRVDIVDALGNRGFAETTEMGAVLVDRSRPKGRIIGLDPSARQPR